MRLVRVHGGYLGWPDERLLTEIPYARFSQEARLAAEARQEDERARLRAAAFQGWHALVAMQGSEKIGGPNEYLERAGLQEGSQRRLRREDPEQRRMKREAERQRAHENAQRVREAFRGGARREGTPTGMDAPA